VKQSSRSTESPQPEIQKGEADGSHAPSEKRFKFYLSMSLWRILAIGVFALATLIGLAGFQMGMPGFAVGGILIWLLTRAGIWSWVRAKKVSAAIQSFTPVADSRRPVVYLRPFEDDFVTAQTFGTSDSYSLKTEEECLAEVMNEIGPFVAIGRPGEQLPEVGAYRKYAQDETWRQEVTNLLSVAQLVILRLGTTAGIEWELGTTLRLVEPLRLLLLVPGELDYKVFCGQYASLFPAGLPQSISSKWSRWSRPGFSVFDVIYFASNWTPSWAPLESSLLYIGMNPFKAALKSTLAPVVRRAGLDFEPLRMTFTAVIYFSMLAIFAFVFLLALYVMLTEWSR